MSSSPWIILHNAVDNREVLVNKNFVRVVYPPTSIAPSTLVIYGDAEDAYIKVRESFANVYALLLT